MLLYHVYLFRNPRPNKPVCYHHKYIAPGVDFCIISKDNFNRCKIQAIIIIHVKIFLRVKFNSNRNIYF